MDVECIKYLSDGSYADIWLAIDELNRSVAIKAMKPEGEGVSTLAQHADVLVRAKHENVVDVYSIEDVNIPKDGLKKCIIMEFVQGVTVDEYLSEERQSRHLYEVGAQILEGLMYIHVKGLVHMDLHERNIMITENNHPESVT